METDGVVIVDVAAVVGAADGVQVDTGRQPKEGGCRVPGFDSEPPGVVGDEDAVEIVGGSGSGSDAGSAQLGDQPALKGAVDPLAAAAGLGAVGKDELDGESVHGDFEMGGFVVALEGMGAAVAGSVKLAGAVEVEALGQAVATADVGEHFEAGIACLLGYKEPLQGPAGGVIGGKDESE